MAKTKFTSPKELFDSIVSALENKQVKVYHNESENRLEAQTSGLDGGTIIIRGSSSGLDTYVEFFGDGDLISSKLRGLVERKYNMRHTITSSDLEKKRYSTEEIANNLYNAVHEYNRISKTNTFKDLIEETSRLEKKALEGLSRYLS